MDFLSFDPRLITENNFHDDNRPYRNEQNIQGQQNLFTNNDNNNEEDNNINEEYMFENQNENRNEDIPLQINENNASEYTTPESTTSQTETSTTTQFVRNPTRIVSPGPNTHDPQSYLYTSPHRNITFNLPLHSDEVVQDETQNITSIRDTSVNFYHLQGLFLEIHEIQLSLYMTLHQFLLRFSSQVKQFNQKIIVIITNKLLVNTMIHLITPFFHRLIQIFKQTIIKLFFNLTIKLI